MWSAEIDLNLSCDGSLIMDMKKQMKSKGAWLFSDLDVHQGMKSRIVSTVRPVEISFGFMSILVSVIIENYHVRE